jgi:hypothetical protein
LPYFFCCCCCPLSLQALEKAGGIVENITWELFKETLLEQAEQVRLKTIGFMAATVCLADYQLLCGTLAPFPAEAQYQGHKLGFRSVHAVPSNPIVLSCIPFVAQVLQEEF